MRSFCAAWALPTRGRQQRSYWRTSSFRSEEQWCMQLVLWLWVRPHGTPASLVLLSMECVLLAHWEALQEGRACT